MFNDPMLEMELDLRRKAKAGKIVSYSLKGKDYSFKLDHYDKGGVFLADIEEGTVVRFVSWRTLASYSATISSWV